MDNFNFTEHEICDYEVFIPYVKGTYAYPYISRIEGEHPVYRLKRQFFARVQSNWRDGGRYYLYVIDRPGIYEVGVKRWDADTKALLSRKVEYFTFDDNNGLTEITKDDVFNMVCLQ